MQAWITAILDDEGIQEIDIVGEPNDANLKYWRIGSPYGPEQSSGAYREGIHWHRTYDDAVKAANKHRAHRIEAAAKEIAHVYSLPPIPT